MTIRTSKGEFNKNEIDVISHRVKNANINVREIIDTRHLNGQSHPCMDSSSFASTLLMVFKVRLPTCIRSY